MGWTMLYLFVFLKLPIVAACYIVWWAVRQTTDTDDVTSDGGGSPRPRRPHPRPAPAPPAAPRRPGLRRAPRRPAPADPLGDGRRPRPRAASVGFPAVSVLSDGTIRRLVDEGRIVIKPWDPSLVQPASVDLRLGDSFRVFHNHRASAIDLRDGPPEGLTEAVETTAEEGFVIHPGEFCLGRTAEWVELPEDVVARIEGKSSLGRLGLIVHATAGFIDPGWKGTLTLELNNLTRVPIKLYPGLLIAQLSFMALDQAAERPYGSRGTRLALPGPGGGHREPLHAVASRAVLLAVPSGSRRTSRRRRPPRRRSTSPRALLVLYAAMLSAVGTARHETFPPSRGRLHRPDAGRRGARRGRDGHRRHHRIVRYPPQWG